MHFVQLCKKKCNKKKTLLKILLCINANNKYKILLFQPVNSPNNNYYLNISMINYPSTEHGDCGQAAHHTAAQLRSKRELDPGNLPCHFLYPAPDVASRYTPLYSLQ